ncbi:MAG: nitroreductase family protein [Candidatus Binataceae bacterium]|nr:nitroreductase family protein [Candidatus Binataceae bacterium]
MDLFDAIYTARTMRKLRPDPIAPEVVTKILDAGIRAGSALNNQHWTFLVITDAVQRKALADIFRQGADAVRRVYSDRALPPHVTPAENQSQLDSALYLVDHYHEAPVILIPCLQMFPIEIPGMSEEDTTLYAMRLAGASMYPAIQNIILAARSFGIGTVVTTTHMSFEGQVRRLLGIPDDYLTFAMMPMGYPIEEFRRVTRKPVRKVTFHDRWGEAWRQD